jgi:SpoVK/Ycf46/Vps4 family AAA+-type ATPase
MNRVQEFNKVLNESSGDEVVDSPDITLKSVALPGPRSTKKKQVLTQYRVTENCFFPMGNIKTTKALPPGIYNVYETGGGVYFEISEIRTDDLLRFADVRYNTILEEIDKFWKIKADYDKMGFIHKRGLLLYGNPGTGKSCLLKQVMEDVVKNGDVVFLPNTNSYILKDGLSSFREVEPNRQILAVMEDIDEYSEHTLLQLLDGDTMFENVLFLGTTNYINKLQPRLLREGRFDRKIRIDNPPLEGRFAYLNHKLGKHMAKDQVMELAKKTTKFSFGQLREFLLSVYCHGYNVDETIKRIRTGREEFELTEKELDVKLMESKLFRS